MILRLLVVAVSLTGSGLAVRSQPAPSAASEALELAVSTDDKLSRIELRVEVDGRTVPAIWGETFDKLFAYYDRNANGRLDEKEAARLPSPFALRQTVWGQSVPYTGPAVPWKELDRDGDGAVTKAELASYYHGHGFGRVLVGVGRPQATDALTSALLKALDADGNGAISEAEWKAAPEALRKYDRNDDELIGPGELVPKTAYPGTLGAILLAPPAATEKSVPERAGLPLVVLPTDPADTYWATAVVARRDRDGDGKLDGKEAGLAVDVFATLDANRDRKLVPAELVAWRTLAPTARYTIRLGKKATDQPGIDTHDGAFGAGRLRIDVRADEGKMPALVLEARTRFLDRFTDADADADGFVEEKEIAKRNQAELKQLLLVADRNGDGKLSREELVAWLDVQDQVAAGHVLLTVLDHAAGLFELLDADHDGSLSVPELRRAWDRVKGAGCLTSEGAFDTKKLPRQLIVTASRGHPVNPLGAARRDGPVWFRAMDRNGDGYVSRREFTGASETFDRLDRDGDGFISPEEASRAEKK